MRALEMFDIFIGTPRKKNRMRQVISKHYDVGGPIQIGQKFLQDKAGYAVQSVYLGCCAG